MNRQWLIRLASLLLFLLVSWLVIDTGLDAITSQRIIEKGVSAPPVTRPEDGLTSDALVVLAERLSLKREYPASEELALQALLKNPASGGAASHLVSIHTQQQADKQTRTLADLSARLWPVHSFARNRLAFYWSRQERVDKTLESWSIILARDPTIHDSYFPAIIAMLASQENRGYLTPYLSDPPSWWDRFFRQLVKEADLETLKWVFEKRSASPAGPTRLERRLYVKRLIDESRWRDAYDVWKEGLDEQQQRFVGPVFNGGFEGELLKEGFGWQVRNHRSVDIERQVTYGMRGIAALQVNFHRSARIDFKHLHQVLFLEPGRYELVMRYRLDGLKNPKGLQWRIRCLGDGERLIGESVAMTGTNPWKEVTAGFTVPGEGCHAQRLVLESATRNLHEHQYKGILWFDDIAVHPVGGAQ